MKTFKGDFDKFLNKIRNNEYFSLSRWGDGELMILENQYIDLTKKGDGEFKYDPNNTIYCKMRNLLNDAYKYVDENYYVGIACQCCVGRDKFEYMKKLSGQSEDNLTWANIFVNSNYQYFLLELLPLLTNKKVILIANKKSNITNLPFSVHKFYPIGTDAWIENYEISKKLQKEISELEMSGYIVLIAAGPLANILTYELWKYSKNNTYIDIGSTLDRHLGLTITRNYLKGADTLKKTCIW